MTEDATTFRAAFDWIASFLENFPQRTLEPAELGRAYQLYAEGEDAGEAAARVAEGR